MKANMTDAERLVRLVAAVVLIVSYFMTTVEGALGQAMLWAALLLLFTSMWRVCPLYLLFRSIRRHAAPAQPGR